MTLIGGHPRYTQKRAVSEQTHKPKAWHPDQAFPYVTLLFSPLSYSTNQAKMLPQLLSLFTSKPQLINTYLL